MSKCQRPNTRGSNPSAHASQVKSSHSRPSLGSLNEVDVITALVSADHMIEVNRKFNLTKASRICDYLATRGLSYYEFRLIQFMAGALPGNTAPILAERRAQQLKLFSTKRLPFLKEKDADINNTYSNLYQKFSNNTYNRPTQTFFEKVRIICEEDFNLKKSIPNLSVSPITVESKNENIQENDEISDFTFYPETSDDETKTHMTFNLSGFSFFESDEWSSGPDSQIGQNTIVESNDLKLYN